QNISGSGSDEADGNNICGFRKKKGVKGAAKYVSPVETEKIQLPNSSEPPDLYDLQGMTGLSEPLSDQSLQTLDSFPPVQKERRHTGSDMEEGTPQERAESQTSADTGKRMTEKLHKEIDTPDKTDVPIQVQPASNEEEARCLDTVSKGRNTERTENEEGECWGTEAAKFCVTQSAPLESTDAVQGSAPGEPCMVATGISKQTLQELENLLNEGSLLNHRPKHNSRAGVAFFPKILKPKEKADKQGRSFETLSAHFGEGNPKHPSFHNQEFGQQSKPFSVLSSAGSDQQQPEGSDVDQPILRLPSTSKNAENSTSESQFDSSTDEPVSSREPDENGRGSPTRLHQFSHIEFIKQQMARDNVQFVRFESIDLHGVSRSKNIPSRFFHEKVIHGVSMPRSYLELTLNPKDSEIDYLNATNFNCDIILNPDLSTFRVLPWTEQTARVICDSFTVQGNPLMTSPRHIAKKQLSQLQDNGFSLRSAFTYEFCIYGITEVVNSKTISFPAATILNNHDQAFIQELIEGMYYAGANIESFSSSSGPGQMEITFHPEFGTDAADSAFTFRTGIKEVAKKYSYVASFFSESGFYNSGILSHSLWDLSGQKNLFSLGYGTEELSDVGKYWLSGLLAHTAAISCLMAPTTSCRKPFSKYSKESKETVNAKWAYNDNSCAFNVKSHDGKGTHIENRLSSATANPYLVLAATVAAGLDGVKRGLRYDTLEEENHISDPKPSSVPLKLEDALVALEKDSCIKEALGETFVQYFVAMKHYELETEEMDGERNKCLGYFI
ncbi:LGSN protein, partial [Nothoprocta pentlandii]|nr:LGSN protein [Nothoprocta pentlandii]